MGQSSLSHSVIAIPWVMKEGEVDIKFATKAQRGRGSKQMPNLQNGSLKELCEIFNSYNCERYKLYMIFSTQTSTEFLDLRLQTSCCHN